MQACSTNQSSQSKARGKKVTFVYPVTVTAISNVQQTVPETFVVNIIVFYDYINGKPTQLDTVYV